MQASFLSILNALQIPTSYPRFIQRSSRYSNTNDVTILTFNQFDFYNTPL